MDFLGGPSKRHSEITKGMPKVHEQAHEAAVQSIIVDEQKQKERFSDLYYNSSKIIFKARSWFPLDLFPDEIIITLGKIDILYNEFLLKRIQPVYYNNVLDVFVNHGVIFSKLTIVDRGFVQNIVEVDRLKRADASEAHEIIQGLVVAVRQGVDLTKVVENDFLARVKEIGRPKTSLSY